MSAYSLARTVVSDDESQGGIEFNKFGFIVAKGAYSISFISCVTSLRAGFSLPQDGETIYPG
jgi:hypothetical protein